MSHFFRNFAHMFIECAHKFLLCLASNHQQEENMRAAREKLASLLPGIRFTPERWTAPINSVREEFYLNQLAQGTTSKAEEELISCLKAIETALGRRRDSSGIVTIDIDILQFDDKRLHQKDWERAYIKNLLEEL